MGLALVLVVLGLFLEFRLAFWVTMGIPTAFLGSLLFLPAVGVPINMLSMFAFIVALGIVVDDAIVAGENIYEYQQKGMGFARAAILGARDVAMPIAFSIQPEGQSGLWFRYTRGRHASGASHFRQHGHPFAGN